MKYLLYTLLILVLFIFQSFFSGFEFLSNIKPDLLLILVIIIAVNQGKRKGILTGLIVGLLEDLFFGGLIGVNAISKMIVGLLFGFFKIYIYKYIFILAPIFVLVGTFINQLIILILLHQSLFEFSFGLLFDELISPLLVNNIIFVFPLYLIVYLIELFISRRKSSVK